MKRRCSPIKVKNDLSFNFYSFSSFFPFLFESLMTFFFTFSIFLLFARHYSGGARLHSWRL